MEEPQHAGNAGRINVTYESLFDLVVREKSKDEIQPLQANFFNDLVSYLNEKKAMLAIMGEEEKERTTRQLLNINRLIRELYERSEKKILGLALARSRAGADIIDTNPLLSEEKALFDSIVTNLDAFRAGILKQLLAAKAPEPPMREQAAQVRTAEQAPQEISPSTTKLIRFLHPVPKFVGKELEVYGPFDQEDIANLPREIAEVLIMKGRAEEMAQA